LRSFGIHRTLPYIGRNLIKNLIIINLWIVRVISADCSLIDGLLLIVLHAISWRWNDSTAWRVSSLLRWAWNFMFDIVTTHWFSSAQIRKHDSWCINTCSYIVHLIKIRKFQCPLCIDERNHFLVHSVCYDIVGTLVFNLIDNFFDTELISNTRICYNCLQSDKLYSFFLISQKLKDSFNDWESVKIIEVSWLQECYDENIE
jgi:hypothetical protein